MKPHLLFIILFFVHSVLFSQSYPTDYFISPVKIPIALSGSFGELRNNHFHSGIDIRINEKIGEPVYAIADGFVSRIRISSTGVGKALYVDHPNGYRSVFFHLDAYVGEIEDYVHNHQQEKKTFEFDIYPEKKELLVKQGQMIAKSGNTGGSGGPHLHFEMRHSHNDQIIDPLYFGFQLKDSDSPEIRGIRVYKSNDQAPVGSHILVSDLTKTISSKVKNKNGKIRTIQAKQKIDTINAWGKLYFGVDVKDRSYNSLTLGIPIIKWYVDDTLIYAHNIETFEFSETRYINSMIDYPEYMKNKKRILLSRVLPGNNIRFIEYTKYKGYFNFTDYKLHKIRLIVKDFHGNQSQRIFYIQSKKPTQETLAEKKSTTKNSKPFFFNQQNSLDLGTCLLDFNKGTFFEDLLFQYAEQNASAPFEYSKIYNLQQEVPIPVFSPFTIKIKPLKALPTLLKKKALIVRIVGKSQISEGGKWDGDFLAAESSTLGSFTIGLDTIPPRIQEVNFSNSKALKSTKLRVRIKDNLSGIASYQVYINNQWTLAEYDAKSNSLSINGSSILKKGKNKIQVEISDQCENVSSKQYEVIL